MSARIFLDSKVSLHAGDCLAVLATLPDVSVDSVVTDPPYGLSFMGKGWDHGVPSVEIWQQAFRVLKPGGHLLAFFGTRTYHRGAVAIEDAGFDIRDQIGWAYGSGFPKSHDVSKGIDRAVGAEREMVKPRSVINHQRDIGNRRPYMDDPDHLTVSDEPAETQAHQWNGWGTALKPAWEPIVLARKPLIGTVAENVLQHGTGAINIDGCRVGGNIEEMVGRSGASSGNQVYQGGIGIDRLWEPNNQGRWPANLIHDGSEEVLAAFPDSDGQQGRISGDEPSVPAKGDVVYGFRERVPVEMRGDSGSAARFFYTAKADGDDRLGSKHPTVKPVDLMQWLVRLVTPKGGVVLDPFAGTGTTGEAAWREGMKAILIEREPEYQADIARRMELATNPTKRAAVAKSKNQLDNPEDLPLFARSC